MHHFDDVVVVVVVVVAVDFALADVVSDLWNQTYEGNESSERTLELKKERETESEWLFSL